MEYKTEECFQRLGDDVEKRDGGSGGRPGDVARPGHPQVDRLGLRTRHEGREKRELV